MGISSADLDLLVTLKEQGYIPNGSSIIEIGTQQISNNFLAAKPLLEKIAQLFDITKPHHFPDPLQTTIATGMLEHLNVDAIAAREFWQWLGLDYASIDIDESPDSIPLDLNYDHTPKKCLGKFSLVTNFGTTEHVANQLNAFKVIHELTAVGGVMLHTLPSQGMLNHGLVNYNPKFFWMLARSNGYKWLYSDFTSACAYYELPQNIVENIMPYKPNIQERAKAYQIADCAIVVAVQKVFNTPYVSPLDVPTGTKTNNKILEERYWSIFQPDPFAIPPPTFWDKVLARLRIKSL